MWAAPLRVGDASLHTLRGWLSDDERARADRLRFDDKRQQAIVSRGLLRGVLGWALDVEPGAIAFASNNFGKPLLAGEFAEADLAFNVSHSGDRLLLAVSHGLAVGVDIERVRPNIDFLRLSERYFSPNEAAALAAVSRTHPHALVESFFCCWTRKEAVIKAVGSGVFAGLDRFDVTLGPSDPPAVLATRWPDDSPAAWSLTHLPLGDGYVGAVAERGVKRAVVLRSLSLED